MFNHFQSGILLKNPDLLFEAVIFILFIIFYLSFKFVKKKMNITLKNKKYDDYDAASVLFWSIALSIVILISFFHK